HACNVSDFDRGRRERGVRRHFDNFDVAFARSIERHATFVIGIPGVRKVHEIDEAWPTMLCRYRRQRTRDIACDDAATAARGGRDDRSCPYVVRRQEQVEVENFSAVLAFQETNLDGLGSVGGVDYRQ